MHNGFLEEWRKQAIVRISVVLRTLKRQEEQAQRLDLPEGSREGFIRDSLPAYSAGHGSAQQKDHYPVMRNRLMRIIRLRTTFLFMTKRRDYILQFTLKDLWLLPRHEKHYSSSDCNLYGWLFIYFGYYN